MSPDVDVMPIVVDFARGCSSRRTIHRRAAGLPDDDDRSRYRHGPLELYIVATTSMEQRGRAMRALADFTAVGSVMDHL